MIERRKKSYSYGFCKVYLHDQKTNKIQKQKLYSASNSFI